MLTAIAEDLAARQLAGLPVTLDEVLRAEGVARRSVQAILANRPEKSDTNNEFRGQRWTDAHGWHAATRPRPLAD
jgi:hypothetical protein